MKESNFYSDDFEQLIREKTEQYKMYPSERVWKGVHNSLHTRRKWFIGSMSLLVTGILFFAGRELISPSAHSVVARKSSPTAALVAETPKPWLAAHIPHTSSTSYRSSNSSSSAIRHSDAIDDDILALEGQEPDYTEYKEISITIDHPVIDPADLSGWLNHPLPDRAPEIAVIGPRINTGDIGKSGEDGFKAGIRPGAETLVSRELADAGHEPGELLDAEGLSARSVLESLSGTQARNARMSGRLAKNRSNGTGVAADGLISDSVSTATKASAATIAEAQDRQRINWLHDYALNTLPQPTKRGRTYFQLTLSPTINYRSLNNIDPSYEKWGPLNGFAVSPSQLMNHSPALGFEFGGSILYRLTRNLTVKGGLQFNFARYKITAFAVSDPNAPQGVNLNSYLGYVVDSLSAPMIASQRGSAAGASSSGPVTVETLNNDYYQLSAPIGFELRVLGNERLTFNLGATVQPSYLLGTTSYMLNEDMTKYNKEPNKYRKFNVSGGLEAFLSYQMGNIRWQIGPEFRYQLLSTYTSKYPISETIKTYGLKIGITKMLP